MTKRRQLRTADKAKRIFWGVDTEASSMGREHYPQDVHSIQVCSSRGKHTGKVFWKPEQFKKWLLNHKGIKLFFAFSSVFEYGSLKAWELLKVQDKKGRHPWQDWADKPINIFYINVGGVRRAIFDIRNFFYQLKYGKEYMGSLKILGDYLSEYYGKDIRKFPKPLGEDFGKRPPTEEEKPYFEKYGIRDAYISAMAAKWFYTNIIKGWLKNKVRFEQLYSWGTIARHYFDLPKINKVIYDGKKRKVIFPNKFHQEIFEGTYAGRSEAFHTGAVGKQFYNDVAGLYAVAIIWTQCLLIKNVELWHGDPTALLNKPTTSKLFYEVTGKPYGWIIGDFYTEDDLWGLPISKEGYAHNYYVKGHVKNRIYHTLDLEASNAICTRIEDILVPVFDPSQKPLMKKYEELSAIKMEKKYKSQVEKYCIKNTTNALSGTLGESHPSFSAITNIPAYDTLLAASHLIMSRMFHRYHSEKHPITYTDTDSFFWDKPVEGLFEELHPFPTLPFQIFKTIPVEIGVKGEPDEHGTAIFRGKLYYQNAEKAVMAIGGWKPFPKSFVQIVQNKLKQCIVEIQKSRKWKTRDKAVATLEMGRWRIVPYDWNYDKIRRIFKADDKRKRETYDSYKLFLENRSIGSEAWTEEELDKFLRRYVDHAERSRSNKKRTWKGIVQRIAWDLEIDLLRHKRSTRKNRRSCRN